MSSAAAYCLTGNINSGIMTAMAKVDELLDTMRRNPKGVSFADLCRVCDHLFGEARQRGGSHRIYRAPGRVTREWTFRTTRGWPRHTG